MDGFDTSLGVVVLAATNHKESVDPALVREGRFDRKCVLELPRLEDRQSLFQMYLKKVPHDAEALDWRTFARRSAGMSPAGIAASVNQAALSAAKHNRTKVENADMLEVLERQLLGAISTSMHRGLPQSLRYRIAVHEIGHATIAHVLKLGVVGAVTVIPRGKALGATTVESDNEFENVLLTESELTNKVCMLLGGREAELLFFGDYSSGATDDLKRASELAMAMVGQMGLQSLYGALSYQPLLNQMRDIPLELREDAARILESATERTRTILRENQRAIQDAAAALSERYTLSGKEVGDILEGSKVISN
jgi:cell division protease FtsH